MVHRLGWVIALSTAIGGCARLPRHQIQPSDMLHFLREHEHEASAIEYRVGIPDAVLISAPRVEEIDGQGQQIQPDGKITLKLLGEVKIVGMTAKEIAAKLEVLLSRYYLDPKVSVRVTSYNSKKYYIYGQTGGQGAHPYSGRDTLIDAVLRSGVNYSSWTSRTKVVRPSHDGTDVRVLHVDLDKMVLDGDWSRNILLEPDDIVYIPPTPLAWVGLRVQEVLQPVAPATQTYLTPAQVRDLSDAYDSKEGQKSGAVKARF